MLTSETKNKLNNACDILVGKIPNPQGQVDQITNALIYKFMDDQDRLSMSVPGGKASFFVGELEEYAWHKLFDAKLSNQDRADLYIKGLDKLSTATKLPELFRDIFKNAYLPFRAPDTIGLFLDTINSLHYIHGEELGNAFEYLLQKMGSQGDAGMFRTPRHIIEFVVKIVAPKKDETILDPACGTAGFLVEAFNQIKNGSKLSPQELQVLANNIEGVDISPEMAKLARVNLYLHGFKTPHISENDTLTNENLWLHKKYDVILANPPFMSPKGGIKPHDKFGVKANKSEVLFVNYIAEHLKLHGRAGIIVPEGIIFQSGNAYKQLRKSLVEDGYLSAVISLPSGVFNPYAGVKTSILILDRQRAKESKEILFVKVENDGYDLGAQRRPIQKNNLPEALELLNKWNNGEKVENKIASTVDKEKIIKSGDYNLTFERHIDVINQINTKWPMVALSDLFEMQNGRAFKKEEWSAEGLPIIRIANLNDITADYNYYNGTYDKKIEVNTNDLLFSWSGTVGTSFGPHLWRRGKGLLNQHIYKFNVINTNQVSNQYAFHSLKFITPQIESKAHGAGGLVHITKSELSKFKIPLPPFEIQEQIVTELDGYQKIVNGAKLVLENWVPKINYSPEWDMINLNEICSFEYGNSMPEKNRIPGKYPVVGSNGVVGTHNDFLVEGPVIVIGRKGSAGEVNWIDENCFPIDTTYFVKLSDENRIELKYLYFTLLGLNLQSLRGGGAVPGLNRNDAYKKKISLPSVEIQKQIIEKIEAERLLVESNKKLIEIYEQKMKDVISKLWN
ncbi:MAG: hypothetical protein RI935_683 [Candidatus Parcubacteria bacterium]|jgi:type I restriction enzyme M protein